jgi:sulfite reductase (NADPH) hemoprotein beta-component
MQVEVTLPVGTYGYQPIDLAFLNDRVAQFREQAARRLSGDLSEDEFKPLRLMNGLYLQLHAYMLRVAVPYGVLSAAQLRRRSRLRAFHDPPEHPVQLD